MESVSAREGCTMLEKLKEMLKCAFKKLPVDRKLIVFESEGDLSDNTYALFEYLTGKKMETKYRYVWFVDREDEARLTMRGKTAFVNKSSRKHYLKRLYCLSVCKYYIYDHNNYFERMEIQKKKGQNIINLWHGCGVKTMPFATEPGNIDYLISLSPLFTEIQTKFFGIDMARIFCLGYPRNDYFFMPLNENQRGVTEKLSQYKKVVLWMPTFRRSNNPSLDEAYFDSQTGLPILDTEAKLSAFDDYLRELNILCIFKIHHLQAALEAYVSQYTNIITVNDDEIHRMGLQLYQYIMLADCLITDYSSVATDFLLLDRPMIFTLDDYEDFKKSRGFCFDDAKQYLPGYHVYDEAELKQAVYGSLISGDSYGEQRKKALSLMHQYRDGQSCQRILDLIGLNGET